MTYTGPATSNTLMTATNLASEFRPYYEVKSNYMIWYDYAVIKLNHLFESMDHIGLTQKLDASLRLWLNCGTVNVTVGNAASAQNLTYNITPANNIFPNTCPLLVHYDASNKIVPDFTTATQYSGAPFPLPIRTSAGLEVTGRSGKIRIQTCPSRFIKRVIAIRAASI